MLGAALAAMLCTTAVGAAQGKPRRPASVKPQTLTLYDSAFVGRQEGSAYMNRLPAKRGMLFVPENRADPRSATIGIGFWIIPSTASRPKAPIVYVIGGPGHANIDTWITPQKFRDLEVLRAVADVILFDQRGSGSPSASIPSLHCPEPFAFPLDQPWTKIEQVRSGMTDGIRRCVDYYRASGRDLRGYDYAQSADDVDDLRKALGYSKINIWGFSAGSSIARFYAERHPQAVERLAIGGVQGVDDGEQSVAKAFRMLQAGDAVEGIPPTPQLGSDLDAILRKLDAAPVDVDTTAPDGTPVTVRLGSYDVLHQLGWATTELPVSRWSELTGAIAQMAKGDFSWVAPRATMWRLGQHRSLIEGKLSGIMQQCAFRPLTPVAARPAKDVFDRFEDFTMSFPCEGILRPYVRKPIQDSDWHVFTGDTLIYNGERDVQTPLDGAMAVRRFYPRAQMLVFVGKSHNIYDPAQPQVNLQVREVARFFAADNIEAGQVVRIAK
ncbi:MAG: alpha/beta fold hydrolase [Sphingomonadales bacterium]|nr:alpha/beta fold hydrolase [Sphingomonadales bacterium]